MSKFKACPFCGSTTNLSVPHPLYHQPPPHYYIVLCGECKAKGPVMATKKAAVESWNLRVSQAEHVGSFITITEAVKSE